MGGMQTFSDLNPATGESLAEIPVTSESELAAAIARARAAQPAWGGLTVEERASRMQGIGALLEEHAEELAKLATQEMGKPLAQSRGEAKGWARHALVELGEVVEALQPEQYETEDSVSTLVRAPLGVVAAITPWNFPIGMPLQILVPALAAGNSVVFKPSELVPLVGAKLAELLQRLLPAGVLELVQGDGSVGASLVAGDVDMIGFVGSRETGMRIMQSASSGLKRLVLELGGKDPLVVMEDADLDAAADCAVRHSLRNSGQVCCSVERVYVAAPIAEEFERRVVERAREWTCGDGSVEGTKLGPMVSELQRSKVAAQVEEALAEGARLAFRGEAPASSGYFYPATVLAEVDESLRISREETFGPVISLTVFSGDEDEGVALANATPYGLGANVYTGDAQRGVRMASRIHAGQVGVNQYLGSAPGLPWVGARQSGFGFLGGKEGHRQFTVPKSISTPKPKS
jgi:acyl-CoA reductase-like NAD-dependent aldehyde dehydrogenase